MHSNYNFPSITPAAAPKNARWRSGPLPPPFRTIRKRVILRPALHPLHTPEPFSLHCIALHGCHEPSCNALHALHATKCNAMHCIALHCIALHCIALRCIALHCIALHCIALHFIALHCVALRCIALHCIALRCIALHCMQRVQRIQFIACNACLAPTPTTHLVPRAHLAGVVFPSATSAASCVMCGEPRTKGTPGVSGLTAVWTLTPRLRCVRGPDMLRNRGQ